MNRSFFLALALVAIFSKKAHTQFKLGIQGGLNISSITPAVTQTYSISLANRWNYSSPRNGWSVGLVGSFELNRSLNLELNADYSRNGHKTIYRQLDVGGAIVDTSTTRLQFTRLRMLISYALPLGTGRASIAAGPNLHYLISGERHMTGYMSYQNVEETYKIKAGKAPGFGLSGAIRYEFRAGLFLAVSYDHMIAAQKNLQQWMLVDTDKINLGVFNFGIGFFLPNRKK